MSMGSQNVMTITCNGRRQTCKPTLLYSNQDGSSEIYCFENYHFTLHDRLPWSLLQQLPAKYALPKRFAIKIRPFNDLAAEHYNYQEKKAYQHLQRLQGGVVPRAFKDVLVEGFEKTAFAIELLSGQSLREISSPISRSSSQLDVERTCRGIHSCFKAITACGVEHGDPDELGNYMLVQRSSGWNYAARGTGIFFLILIWLIDWRTTLRCVITVRSLEASY